MAPPPMVPATTAIRLEGVAAGYHHGPDVFRDVTLDLSAGDTAVVTGPGGAGKSTLLHVLRGAILAREGRAVLLGSDAATLPQRLRAGLRRRIGYVAQAPVLIAGATAHDNVAAPLTIENLAGAGATDIDELLAWCGVAPGAAAETLSASQRRVVAIARALIVRPLLLLADEPLVGLASEQAARVLRLFSETARQGAAVVIATQTPDAFDALPAARWRLEGGRVDVLAT